MAAPGVTEGGTRLKSSTRLAGVALTRGLLVMMSAALPKWGGGVLWYEIQCVG